MNTRIFNLITIAVISFLLASCAGSEKLAYMQTLKNSDGSSLQSTTSNLYEARIKPKDLLSITVVTSEVNASRIYNLLVPQISDANSDILYTTPAMQPYLVDNNGEIDFPLLGKLKVIGLTRRELEATIRKQLEPAFSRERPIITIRIINYSVNILGEVSRPGKYSSTNDRLTIFEGLALAGDLTIYGRRDNIKVLRENAEGAKTFIMVNLNDKNAIYSPAYYLEQNDVVYVEPNKSKSKSSNINAAETLSVTALSIIISLTSLVFNVFR